MTASAEFEDPRLVSLYDHLNPWAADNAFYLALAPKQPSEILDVGCGTGALACRYAELGHRVVGVDPSESMLAFARTRPSGDRVEWIQGRAQDLSCEARFDLIVMTGHAFQFLAEDSDIRSTLGNMRSLLCADGRIAFETRNPLERAWERWTKALTRKRIRSGADVVEVWVEAESHSKGEVHYSVHYRFESGGPTLVSTSTLRFLGREQLEPHILRAGLRLERVLGDWDGSPYSEESREIIVIASRC